MRVAVATLITILFGCSAGEIPKSNNSSDAVSEKNCLKAPASEKNRLI
jgi:hypothetical protein